MATKGWSFGALTDALRSAAFVDASVTPTFGEIPVINTAGSLVIPYANKNSNNGLVVNGPKDYYPIQLYQIQQGNGSIPTNWFSSLLQFNSGSGNNCAFGIVRGEADNALGYALAQDGVMRHQYFKGTGRHKISGNIYTQEINLGPQDTSSTGQGTVYLNIKPEGANSFTMRHQSHAWTFSVHGTINGGSISGNEVQAGLRVQPDSGSWEEWISKPAGLQVDLTGASAAVMVRSTLWGNRHVSSIVSAFANNQCTIRTYAGGTVLTQVDNNGDETLTLNKGGMRMPGSLTAAYVRSGNGSSILHPDGNIEGSQWGGYLNNWIYKNFVQAVRCWGRTNMRDTGGLIQVPSGCVFVGMSGANYDPNLWGTYTQLQYLIQGNWVNVTGN